MYIRYDGPVNAAGIASGSISGYDGLFSNDVHKQFTQKPDRDKLIELRDAVNIAQDRCQAFRMSNANFASAKDQVEYDLGLRDAEKRMHDASNAYYLAIDLYHMSREEFAAWQFQNKITPRPTGVSVKTERVNLDEHSLMDNFEFDEGISISE